MSVLPARLEIVVELTFNGNRVGCGTLRGDSSEPIEAFMAPARPTITRETFQFFKDLGRHNHKEWMDANRERYQAAVVQPFRRLLEEMTPRYSDRRLSDLFRRETQRVHACSDR